MSVDARETIELLDAARKTFQTISIQNAGRVVGTPGDFVLALFKTAAGATAAALAIQHELETRAGGVEKNRRLRFRVGLHLGDVVQTADGSVYGDGVNVAARLQSLAPAGGIVASESIQLAVRGKVAADFVDLGDQTLKNIAGPVRAYRVVVSGQGSGALATSFEATTRIDSPPTPLSVLVLPFANQSNDDKTNYIADALTMSITADLSRIRDAFVVPAMNALTYRTKALTVQQVANDAGVRFVLHGSVLASGQRLRVTAHLLDSKTGAQLWSERFMGDLSDLFALQDEVTARVGNSIGEHMVIVAAREVETRKSGAQVTDLLLRARALNFRPYSTENLVERERLYREALSLEPNNVNAMIGLAIALAIHSQWLDNSDASRGKRLSDARDMALRVRAIDPCLRGIELPLYLYAQEHNDFDGARRSLEAALAKDSKDPSAYGNFALFHLNMGEPERALPLLKQPSRCTQRATSSFLPILAERP